MKRTFWDTIIRRGDNHKSVQKIKIRYVSGEEELINHYDYHYKCTQMSTVDREMHEAFWTDHEGNIFRRR